MQPLESEITTGLTSNDNSRPRTGQFTKFNGKLADDALNIVVAMVACTCDIIHAK